MSDPTRFAMVGGGIIVLALYIGVIALAVYILAYRIPKALIRYAIRTYFDEKWNMEHRNQQNPQIRY